MELVKVVVYFFKMVYRAKIEIIFYYSIQLIYKILRAERGGM